MKKIDAIIRKLKFEDIKKALYITRFEWFSYRNLTAFCRSAVSQVVKGQVFHSNYLQRFMLSIVDRGENPDNMVNDLMAGRNGESGPEALFNKWASKTNPIYVPVRS